MQDSSAVEPHQKSTQHSQLKLPQWLRNGLWPKAFLNSVLLENVIVPTNKTASAYKLFHGEDDKG